MPPVEHAASVRTRTRRHPSHHLRCVPLLSRGPGRAQWAPAPAGLRAARGRSHPVGDVLLLPPHQTHARNARPPLLRTHAGAARAQLSAVLGTQGPARRGGRGACDPHEALPRGRHGGQPGVVSPQKVRRDDRERRPDGRLSRSGAARTMAGRDREGDRLRPPAAQEARLRPRPAPLTGHRGRGKARHLEWQQASPERPAPAGKRSRAGAGFATPTPASRNTTGGRAGTLRSAASPPGT